jgi:hypothetical protein
MSNQIDERPFQEAFDAITPGSPIDPDDPGVFDGSYQCRRCGTIQQIGMFAGAATPPTSISTDCKHCNRGCDFDGIAPDGESVRHRWYVSFEDIYHDPPYLTEFTATSREAASTQLEHDYPDRTIEGITHLEARVDE